MVVTVLPRGGWTPLMYAARDGAADAVAALADLKADLNASDPGRHDGADVRHHQRALRYGGPADRKGADPNVADSTGMTALYAAVDMHTLGPMLSRPSPKLVDKLDCGRHREDAAREGREPRTPG